MLGIKRKESILELINQNENIKLNKLVEILGYSEATIRRDLNELQKDGKVKRVHGGAVLNVGQEQDVQFKKEINPQAKNKIAKYAASLVEDGDKIYLDAGSTTEAMIKYLKGKKVVVITNGISHLNDLISFKIETYLIGGKIKETTSSLVGSLAEKTIKNYSFNKVFMGVNCMNEKGYFTPDIEEAGIKSAAVLMGNKVYFLCDHSKIGTQSFVKFAELDSGILITDKKIKSEKYNQIKMEVSK
ncbi:MAG: DeoR/GlpR family DNA-binding transcription regulator [Fusobacteriaceae bacterium]